jgi:hypothetical protein
MSNILRYILFENKVKEMKTNTLALNEILDKVLKIYQPLEILLKAYLISIIPIILNRVLYITFFVYLHKQKSYAKN